MSRELIVKKVELRKANVERFYELYNSTSLTWALDMLLEQFILAHEVTPENLAAVGAKELKRMMGGNSDSVSDI